MNEIFKIVQALEDSNILLKVILKQLKMKRKKKKQDFLEFYYRIIFRMNVDSMRFILEIIYLKNKRWGICNEP